MTVRLFFCAAFAAAVVLLSACGGGGGSSATSGPAASGTTTPPGNAPATVSTIAGDSGQTYVDGAAADARFASPTTIAMDSAGNTYVVDNNRIRKVSPLGTVTTLAGNGSKGFVDGAGSSAQFNNPVGLAADSAGNVYVADTANNAIRKISPAGIVSTLAGNGKPGYTDGTGATAQFSGLMGIVADSAGNVYVADAGSNVIRKITAQGTVTTFAGKGHGFQLDENGNSIAATIDGPNGLALDSAGNIYVAEGAGSAIRKITPSAQVSTVFSFFSQVAPDIPRLVQPMAVAVDGAGNIFITIKTRRSVDPWTRAVMKITPAGVASTLAGQVNTFADGYANAQGEAAAFGILGDGTNFVGALGLAVDGNGNVRVADPDNRAIRSVSPTGLVTTVIGQGPA